MPKKILSKISKYLPQILALLFVLAFAVYAWTEPTTAPPGGNVAAPLNVSNVGQIKIGGLILNTGGAATGLIVDKGESLFPSITIVGGTSLPICDASKRGKQFLLQGASGQPDGLYICKKKIDDSYGWVRLGSPEIVNIWKAGINGGPWPPPPGGFQNGQSYLIQSATVPETATRVYCQLGIAVHYAQYPQYISPVYKGQSGNAAYWMPGGSGAGAEIGVEWGARLSYYSPVESSWEGNGGGTLEIFCRHDTAFGFSCDNTKVMVHCYYTKVE